MIKRFREIREKFDLDTFSGQKAAKEYLRERYIKALEEEYNEAEEYQQNLMICYNTRIDWHTLEAMDYLVFLTSFSQGLTSFYKQIEKAYNPDKKKKDTDGVERMSVEDVTRQLEMQFANR